MPNPEDGPPPSIGSPLRSISFAVVESPPRSPIDPDASPTSGRARTCSSRPTGTVALPLDDHSTTFLPLITASVFSYELEKISSNALPIVSVRM